jgi:hypothetical protein
VGPADIVDQFTWTDDMPQGTRYNNAVWTEGQTVYRFFLDEQEPVESLFLGVAGATGVSGGSAHTVPRLLMPDSISGLSLTELRFKPTVEPDAIDGCPCYVIVGLHPGGSSAYTLWIDSKTWLLRRLQDDNSTAYYSKALFDAPIPDASFDFKPLPSTTQSRTRRE